MRALTTLVGVIATLGAPFATASTTSGAWNSIPTVTVQVAGLDLASEAGQRVLYRRLQGAAETACSSLDTSRSLAIRRQFRRCVKETIAKALTQVRHPGFVAYAEQRLALVSEGATAAR
jgi:UrcA family protein